MTSAKWSSSGVSISPQSTAGASLAAQGRYEEAEALMRPAYVTLQEQRGARSPRTRRALARRARG